MTCLNLSMQSFSEQAWPPPNALLPASPSGFEKIAMASQPKRPSDASRAGEQLKRAGNDREADSYLLNAISAINLWESIFPVAAFIPVTDKATRDQVSQGQLYWGQLVHWTLVSSDLRLMLLCVCVCVSGALVFLGTWVDPSNLTAYALALILAPLVLGLVWMYSLRFLWDEPVNRMLRTINSQLDLPSGQLLECEELLSINTTVQQLLMLLLTNASVLTNTLSRPVLLTALAASPLAMGVLVSFYYTQRVTAVARAHCRLWQYWQLLQVHYNHPAPFKAMEAQLQKRLLQVHSGDRYAGKYCRTLAHLWHRRAAMQPRPHWLKQAWWAFVGQSTWGLPNISDSEIDTHAFDREPMQTE